MDLTLVAMTLPDLRNPDQFALFLDFDGTLVAIADRPDDVRLDPETRDALAGLDGLLAGALSVVARSQNAPRGRFLAPLRLVVARRARPLRAAEPGMNLHIAI